MTASRPCGARRSSAASSAGLQLLEFAIDVDAQRLEHAGRRMFVAGAARRLAARNAGDALDQAGELEGALERP